MKAIRFTFLTLVLLSSSLNQLLQAQVIFVSGPLSGNTTWSADTVKVTGDVTIPNGLKLSISPGTFVQFQGYYQIIIYGSLQAVGNVQDSVYFSAADTVGHYHNLSTAGGWKGLDFQFVAPTNDSSFLDYCVIQFAKKELQLTSKAAVGIMQTSRIRISNCHFRYNNYNAWSGAITMFISSPTIINNWFDHNTGDFGGAIGASSGSNPLIKGNTIVNNLAYRAGGAIFSQTSNPIITNNFVANNSTIMDNCGPADGAGAIRCTNGSTAYIANNVIVNNNTGMNGGGIQCMYGSNCMIVNNTIVNNYSANYGGGLYCMESSPILKNNILWGNLSTQFFVSQQVVLWSEDSEPAFINCDVQGGSAAFFLPAGVSYTGSAYSGNFDADPLFLSPTSGAGSGFDGYAADWRFGYNSPCLDAGTMDSLGPELPTSTWWADPRLSISKIDVGAYELPDTTHTSTPDFQNSQFEIFPVPAADRVYILPSRNFQQLSFWIYNAQGSQVMAGNFRNNEPVILQLEGLSAGIYQLRLVMDGIRETRTILK